MNRALISCSVAPRWRGRLSWALLGVGGTGASGTSAASTPPGLDRKTLGAGGHQHRGRGVDRMVRTTHKRLFVAGTLFFSVAGSAPATAQTDGHRCADRDFRVTQAPWPITRISTNWRCAAVRPVA